MRAKLLQLCPTLYDPMDCSLPGSSVHGILQRRILQWVAMPRLWVYVKGMLKENSHQLMLPAILTPYSGYARKSLVICMPQIEKVAIGGRIHPGF